MPSQLARSPLSVVFPSVAECFGQVWEGQHELERILEGSFDELDAWSTVLDERQQRLEHEKVHVGENMQQSEQHMAAERSMWWEELKEMRQLLERQGELLSEALGTPKTAALADETH